MSADTATSPSAGTVPSQAVAHRLDFVRYVLEEAEPWHRAHLGRLYDLWQRWNGEHFGGRLVPPYILLSEPVAPSVYGDCSPVSGFGGKSQIRIRPSLLRGTHPAMRAGDDHAEGRFRFAADVLLHEMTHQYHQEVTGQNEESYHGHGPAFRDGCNRIGAALGLAPVRDMKKRGAGKELPSCAQWPHNVRPPDYYGGAYVPNSGDGDTTEALPPSRLSVGCTVPNSGDGDTTEARLATALGRLEPEAIARVASVAIARKAQDERDYQVLGELARLLTIDQQCYLADEINGLLDEDGTHD